MYRHKHKLSICLAPTERVGQRRLWLEAEPAPSWSDMSSRVIGLGFRVQHERVHEAPCEDPHDLRSLVHPVRRGVTASEAGTTVPRRNAVSSRVGKLEDDEPRRLVPTNDTDRPIPRPVRTLEVSRDRGKT